MAKKISKIQEGFILKEEFSGGLTSPWILSPSNANVSFVSGMTILKSNSDVSVYRDITEERCVIDVYNTFNPLSVVDKAVISIFENEDLSLDVEEYYDDTLGTSSAYPIVRIVKNKYNYKFYASKDGLTWDYLGGGDFGLVNPKLKITLVGGGNVDYIINKITMYVNPFLRIQNISTGNKVKIYNTFDELISQSVVGFGMVYVDVDVSKIENNFDGYIKILQSDDTEIYTSDSRTLCGGDIYYYGYTLDIVLDEDGTTLEPMAENNLGDIGKGTFEKKYRLVNNCGNDFTKCILNIVARIDGTYNKVFIAPDVIGLAGTYDKTLDVGAISDGEIKYFWLKINKEETIGISNLYFSLDVELE